MTSHQQSFLNAIGASLDDDGHSHFNTEPASANLISALPYYGLLAISGPETAKFLQGQTTCDLNKVSDTGTVAGAYCTPKGRMHSSFHIGRLDETRYLLRMRRDIVDSTRDTLAKYIVFSKAEQENASDHYQVFGLQGEQARQAIADTFGQAPAGRWQAVADADKLAIQLDDAGTLFECWVATAQAVDCWQALARLLTPAGSSHWAQQMIAQGWADVCAATVGLFIPQMLNYQHTGAISFNKGCYTGQEVVARMHYRGKSKRRMYRARVKAIGIEPGTAIYHPDSEQSIGNIVNAVAIDASCSEVLAVIAILKLEDGKPLNTQNGDILELLALPYSVED
jgi:hypothetical protein